MLKKLTSLFNKNKKSYFSRYCFFNKQYLIISFFDEHEYYFKLPIKKTINKADNRLYDLNIDGTLLPIRKYTTKDINLNSFINYLNMPKKATYLGTFAKSEIKKIYRISSHLKKAVDEIPSGFLLQNKYMFCTGNTLYIHKLKNMYFLKKDGLGLPLPFHLLQILNTLSSKFEEIKIYVHKECLYIEINYMLLIYKLKTVEQYSFILQADAIKTMFNKLNIKNRKIDKVVFPKITLKYLNSAIKKNQVMLIKKNSNVVVNYYTDETKFIHVKGIYVPYTINILRESYLAHNLVNEQGYIFKINDEAFTYSKNNKEFIITVCQVINK